MLRDHRMLSPDADVPALEISNATLRLTDGGPALFQQLNLKIAAGERVGIVGRTGSGKTSLVRLLNGLVQPETGTVLINGMPIGAIPRSHMHRHVGTVFQQPWLFSGTLRDNVSLGHNDLDDGALDQALQMAGLNNDHGDNLPLSMPIADQGINLSGGQRQAVSLARAFAFDPSIYLLDEPSSSLDTQFENRLVTQITGRLAQQTFVIVTHKAQMLDLCTRIIVMNWGQIAKDMSIAEYKSSIAPAPPSKVTAAVNRRKPIMSQVQARPKPKPALTPKGSDET
ncbi:MAG: ATP-binding cassette domain-containing protein [Planktomarina sp.]